MKGLIQKSTDLACGAFEYLLTKRGEAETEFMKEFGNLCGLGFVRLAGLAGGTAVIMAAYGAHDLPPGDDKETVTAKEIFESGNKMHIMHSLALMGVPFTTYPRLVCSVMIAGMIIFSGSCYYTAITGNRSVTKFTPYGGMLLILSWFLMLL